MQVHSSTVSISWKWWSHNCSVTENKILNNIRSHAEVFLGVPEMLLKYRENSNRIRTHNHLVRTQTLNHLAKLALRNTYKGFDCSMKMRSSFFTENQLFHMQYFWGDHPKNYPNYLLWLLGSFFWNKLHARKLSIKNI